MAGLDLDIAGIHFFLIAPGGAFYWRRRASCGNGFHLAVDVPIHGRKDVGNNKRAVFLGTDPHFLVGVTNDFEVPSETTRMLRKKSDLHARHRLAMIHEAAANHGAIGDGYDLARRTSWDCNHLRCHTAGVDPYEDAGGLRAVGKFELPIWICDPH